MERILEQKYKLNKRQAKEAVARARQVLGLPAGVLWSSDLENECVSISDARGWTNNGLPCDPEPARYYSIYDTQKLFPIGEHDTVTPPIGTTSLLARRKLNAGSSCTKNRRTKSRRDNTRSKLTHNKARVTFDDSTLRAPSSSPTPTPTPPLEGFLADVLGGKSPELLQDNAKSSHCIYSRNALDDDDDDSRSSTSATVSSYSCSSSSDDISTLSSNSGWKWGSPKKEGDGSGEKRISCFLGRDDMDAGIVRQLSLRFDTNPPKQAAASAAAAAAKPPKVPKRRGSLDTDDVSSCSPPSTVLVR